MQIGGKVREVRLLRGRQNQQTTVKTYARGQQKGTVARSGLSRTKKNQARLEPKGRVVWGNWASDAQQGLIPGKSNLKAWAARNERGKGSAPTRV